MKFIPEKFRKEFAGDLKTILRDWRTIISQISIIFGERLENNYSDFRMLRCPAYSFTQNSEPSRKKGQRCSTTSNLRMITLLQCSFLI